MAPSRRLSIIALFAVAVAGLTWYCASKQPRFAPRFGGPFTQPRETTECAQRDAEVERRVQVLVSRSTLKEHAVRELLAGRLTLGQAAARFRVIEWEFPVTWCPPRTADGQGEDEHLCRDIMARAHGWVAENLPEAAALVAARLKAELQQLRGPDGVVRLPE
jgi:hypothetical protein